ncbi:MAG: ABC transporter permease subunit [Candidatus Thorarchaeota archaeon]
MPTSERKASKRIEETEGTSYSFEWRGLTSRGLILKVLLPAIILLILWQIIGYIADEITLIDVGAAFIKLIVKGDTEGNTLLLHTSWSLFRVIFGFILAIVTAVPLGIAIGRYKTVDAVFGPVVDAMRPIPPIAWIPISILMFKGLQYPFSLLVAQVFIIWIGAFFPILLNTTAGVKRTNSVHLDVCATFGATERQVLRRVVIPSALPEVLAGLRVGFGIGWMCLVAAEIIGGGLGLGYLVSMTQQLGRTGETISAMLVIGFIGFVLSYLFLYAERKMLAWRQDVSV